MFSGCRTAGRISTALLWMVAVLAAGCDATNQQDDFAEQASRAPLGITRVSSDGEVLEEDEDDWRTAPVYVGEIRVDPAQPNPVSVSDFVTVPVTVTVFDAVRAPLRLEARFQGDRRLVTLDVIEEASAPGAYVFTFPASALGATGLHRLFIFDGVGEIVSYGDLLVQ